MRTVLADSQNYLDVREAYVAIVHITQSELACVSSKGHEDLYSEYDIEPPI